jgi:hypothetical protein
MTPINNSQIKDPPIPDYKWVQGIDNGCTGCAFRPLSTGIRCSRIPCQRYPGMVAQLVSA